MAERTFNWLSLVVEADPDHYEKEEVYEFSDGRVFLNTDSGTSGIYDE